jgi:peptidoglycan-associated lipoprotein
MRKSFVLALLLFASAMFAGCSSPPVAAPAAMASSTPTPVVPGPAAQGSAGLVMPAPVAVAPLAPHLDPKNPISTERSVYFDFEDVSIKAAYASLIERQGKYLASKPPLSITIEGNTDERGGSEYNLALGQKRAEAVLRALKIYGVKDAQMEAVSWGKERPKATGNDEAAWAQNRRADIVYPVK